MSSRAAVTGATGFIGGALAAELRRSGWDITALVRPGRSTDPLERLGAQLVPGDLSDPSALARLVRDADVVHHVAAVVRARDPVEFERSNVAGTRRLLDACAARGGAAPRMVLVSSLAAAGPSPDGRLLTEADAPHPVTGYGRSKLAQEAVAAEYRGRVEVVCIRPPVVYGPGDRAMLFLFRLAMMGFSPRILGGTERNCMIHVEDLARTLALAGTRGEGAYFATDGEVHDSFEVSREIARSLGRRTLTLPAPIALAHAAAAVLEALTPRSSTPVLNREKVADLQQRFWVCSDTRARAELGHSPRWGLRAGLEQTAGWYREHRWL